MESKLDSALILLDDISNRLSSLEKKDDKFDKRLILVEAKLDEKLLKLIPDLLHLTKILNYCKKSLMIWNWQYLKKLNLRPEFYRKSVS